MDNMMIHIKYILYQSFMRYLKPMYFPYLKYCCFQFVITNILNLE